MPSLSPPASASSSKLPWRVGSMLAPSTLLEGLILWPLELYEALAILPVRFLRRHLPLLGGTLVVAMTLQGILIRLVLESLHAIFARITFSRDPVLNYRTFWLAMRDRYALLERRQVDWHFVHQLFGEAVQPSTSEDDLWMAIQESVALCNDPTLCVSRTSGSAATGLPQAVATTRGRPFLASAVQSYERNALRVIEQSHLTNGGNRVSNHFVYGILNAETSPGWRIGYISLSAMEGFVDFPLPRMDSLLPAWTSPQDDMKPSEKSSKDTAADWTATTNVVVPKIYDLESMRWALEAILKSLGDMDGLILDLRFNQGGGSLMSALTVASFFAESQSSLAFSTDEKLPGGAGFSRPKKYYIPVSSRSYRYRGPLAVLQSSYTRGYDVTCFVHPSQRSDLSLSFLVWQHG